MTKVDFSPQFEASAETKSGTTMSVSFRRVANLLGDLRVLSDLTDINPVEFEQIDIPGSAIYHGHAQEAADRIKNIDTSARRGRAATYIVQVDKRMSGLVSFMYPDPKPLDITGRVKQRFAPASNTTRDFAGWLRTDRLSDHEPADTARIVLDAATALARNSHIKRLEVSIASQVLANPQTNHLISVESQAPHVGFAFSVDQSPQRTEGLEVPGSRYIMNLIN